MASAKPRPWNRSPNTSVGYTVGSSVGSSVGLLSAALYVCCSVGSIAPRHCPKHPLPTRTWDLSSTLPDERQTSSDNGISGSGRGGFWGKGWAGCKKASFGVPTICIYIYMYIVYFIWIPIINWHQVQKTRRTIQWSLARCCGEWKNDVGDLNSWFPKHAIWTGADSLLAERSQVKFSESRRCETYQKIR